MKKYTITPLRFLSICKWGIGLFSLIGIVFFVLLMLNKGFLNRSLDIDSAIASRFGDFDGGLIGTFFSIIGVLLIILTLLYQTIENRKIAVTNQFFKMLEFHNENINRLKIRNIEKSKKTQIVENKRAFVIFRRQIKELLKTVKSIHEELDITLDRKELIDIVYIVFYYGIEREWEVFLKKKVNSQVVDKLFERKKNGGTYYIGRTNQTSLSPYYRNLYNAIKLIDSSIYLTEDDKSTNIEILRAQLSNPELFVLYYYLMSRFGKEWIKNNYVTKYELLKSMPDGYCDEFDPKDFSMQYEDEEMIS